MIADEIDGAGPAEGITEGTYFRPRLGAGCAIMPALMVIDVAFRVGLHLSTGPVAACLFAAAFGLGRLAVAAHLRRRGLYRGGRSVEAWAPAGAPRARDAMLDLRTPLDHRFAVSVICAIAVAPRFVPTGAPGAVFAAC